MKPHRHSCLATFLAVLLLVGPLGFAAPKPKGALIDLTKSKPDKTNNDYNLGPTGALGWMYVESGMTEEARQILITKVEKGSPADGKLEVGDVILGVFGQPFTTDARRTFGLAIGRAEAADGVLPLTVWRSNKTETVILQLQVMGAYSETSPYNCPKAAKILEQGLAVIAKNIGKDARFHINELALLASGKPEYLDLVRKRAQEVAAGTPDGEALWSKSNHGGMHAWGHGYSNLFLCEYYLATGDKSVLPAIRSYTTTIARGQGHFGTWGHGYVPPTKDGKLHGPVPPYGPVNASGLPCFVSIILALKCGLEDPELLPAIDRANQFFGYYSGKGSIPYGEHRPGPVHDDNGKSSMTAVAFTLEGRKPEAQFFAKMVTASYESREWGHTGNGFSYLWGPIAANCGGPKAMAAFMKELRWYYDLARRWDGSFVNVGTGGGTSSAYYAISATGSYMLGYAVPLKKLAITGRNAQPDLWLSDKDIAEAIAAERWVGAGSYDKRPVQQLLDGLGSWSPRERIESAQELAKRKDDVLQQLVEMTKSKNPNARLGAVNALGELRKRAIPALDTLAALLHDDDRWLRVQTSEALRTIGADAKAVLPQMLKAATVKDTTDPMQFGVGALAYALFYPGGAYGPKGILAEKGSFEAIPKEQIYPVIRMVAVNPDSAARGCLKSAYANFTLEDLQALAPEVVTSISEMATANAMFSKGIRLAGIQAMARLKIEEGIPLTIMMMNLPDWGKAYIRAESLKVLKEYRGAAKSVVPDLKKIADESPKEKAAIMEVVSLIESDTNPPKLISLKEHLKKQPAVGQK
jgi:HEAT repeat protein